MSYFKKREGKKHYEGKIRVGSLFQSQMGYDAFFEVPSIEHTTFHDLPITYYFDVLLGIKGYKNYEYRGFVICEVDGRIGHRTLKTDSKAYKRDNHFLTKYGIPTVRFATEDLVGGKKIDESMLIAEMDYQLQGYADSYRPYYCFVCETFGFDRDFCSECNRVGSIRLKVRSGAGPNMATPQFQTKNYKTVNYQRKTIPLPPEKKYHICTWCNHSFKKHSFAGCSECSRCVTGIIHSSDKKDT